MERFFSNSFSMIILLFLFSVLAQECPYRSLPCHYETALSDMLRYHEKMNAYLTIHNMSHVVRKNMEALYELKEEISQHQAGCFEMLGVSMHQLPEFKVNLQNASFIERVEMANLTIHATGLCPELSKTSQSDDPCCNITLSHQQCCQKRDIVVPYERVTSFSNVIDSCCQHPEKMKKAIQEFQEFNVIHTLQARHGFKDMLNRQDYVQPLMLLSRCLQKASPMTKCAQDEDCFGACRQDVHQCALFTHNVDEAVDAIDHCLSQHLANARQRHILHLILDRQLSHGNDTSAYLKEIFSTKACQSKLNEDIVWPHFTEERCNEHVICNDGGFGECREEGGFCGEHCLANSTFCRATDLTKKECDQKGLCLGLGQSKSYVTKEACEQQFYCNHPYYHDLDQHACEASFYCNGYPYNTDGVCVAPPQGQNQCSSVGDASFFFAHFLQQCVSTRLTKEGCQQVERASWLEPPQTKEECEQFHLCHYPFNPVVGFSTLWHANASCASGSQCLYNASYFAPDLSFWGHPRHQLEWTFIFQAVNISYVPSSWSPLRWIDSRQTMQAGHWRDVFFPDEALSKVSSFFDILVQDFSSTLTTYQSQVLSSNLVRLLSCDCSSSPSSPCFSPPRLLRTMVPCYPSLSLNFSDSHTGASFSFHDVSCQSNDSLSNIYFFHHPLLSVDPVVSSISDDGLLVTHLPLPDSNASCSLVGDGFQLFPLPSGGASLCLPFLFSKFDRPDFSNASASVFFLHNGTFSSFSPSSPISSSSSSSSLCFDVPSDAIFFPALCSSSSLD